MPSLEFLAVLLGVVVGLAILFYAFVWSQPSSPCAGDMRPKRPKRSTWSTWHGSPPPMPKPPAPIWRVPMPAVKPPRVPSRTTLAERYKSIGCPECGHLLKYGLDRSVVDCQCCGTAFDPLMDGRRYKEYRK